MSVREKRGPLYPATVTIFRACAVYRSAKVNSKTLNNFVYECFLRSFFCSLLLLLRVRVCMCLFTGFSKPLRSNLRFLFCSALAVSRADWFRLANDVSCLVSDVGLASNRKGNFMFVLGKPYPRTRNVVCANLIVSYLLTRGQVFEAFLRNIITRYYTEEPIYSRYDWFELRCGSTLLYRGFVKRTSVLKIPVRTAEIQLPFAFSI